jgi:crotonobetainyl-CoA:carnitine CoA-transferase CaiB-like acyl-CoA transferase
MFHTSSDRRSRREAIAAIMAEYGVSETSAYAMHVRAAAGLPTKLMDHHPEPSEAPTTGQSKLTA